ncbi:MAG TPA: flavin reductase family protein [Longimicrobiaceae bacterium]|nr:flavin reductase family protein [Longimicrobiaceae bacterium]
MSRRPIQATIRTGPDDPDGEGVGPRLREALSQWASGVAVLAASDGEDVEAITVTAFSAVSMDPPLVLVCVGLNSAVLPTLLEERRFTVGFLAADDRRVASYVAQRLPLDRPLFADPADPVMPGALATLVCRLWEDYPGGDHRILVGEVERVELGREAEPLLYFRREYRGFDEKGKRG